MRDLALVSILLSAILLVPVLVVCVECVAALLPVRRLRATRSTPDTERSPVLIIIPAHNEEAVIGRTLSDIRRIIKASDRVLVVADNCTDKTAELSRGFSVEVIERQDLIRVGKGFALDYAARHLANGMTPTAQAVVVVIDADCRVAPNTLNVLAEQVTRTGHPAQAIYVMDSPLAAGPAHLVSRLAFLVRNLVRPRGLNRLGLPCSLTGSGMAFPWAVFRDAQLATGCIVEDLRLGVQLLIDGHPASLSEDARITGTLPGNRKVGFAQRTRWEHGHVRLALTQVPRLMVAAFTRGRFAAMAMALDLAVPPLSMLIMMLFGATFAAAIMAAFGGSDMPVILLLIGNLALAVCLVMVWVAFGYSILPLSSAVAVPRYVLSKFPMYARFFTHQQKQWIKTSRDKI